MYKLFFVVLLFAQGSVFGATLREEVAAVNAAYPGTCQAWTDCLDPYGYPYGRVACVSYGPYCTWQLQPYRFVTCTGTDAYGNYVNYTLNCPF